MRIVTALLSILTLGTIPTVEAYPGPNSVSSPVLAANPIFASDIDGFLTQRRRNRWRRPWGFGNNGWGNGNCNNGWGNNGWGNNGWGNNGWGNGWGNGNRWRNYCDDGWGRRNRNRNRGWF